MRHPFYESRLEQQITVYPQELCFMLSEEDMLQAPGKLAECIGWVCRHPQIRRLIIHISTQKPEKIRIDTAQMPGTVRLVSGNSDTTAGSGSPDIIIAVGKSGKQEICDAITAMAREHCRPEDVTESVIEDHLSFKVSPDFVIKTGGSHLRDFLIWQSIYSELFFTDVNWMRFRRVDFLRALRDFQSRKRRFGK